MSSSGTLRAGQLRTLHLGILGIGLVLLRPAILFYQVNYLNGVSPVQFHDEFVPAHYALVSRGLCQPRPFGYRPRAFATRHIVQSGKLPERAFLAAMIGAQN